MGARRLAITAEGTAEGSVDLMFGKSAVFSDGDELVFDVVWGVAIAYHITGGVEKTVVAVAFGEGITVT